MPASIGFTSPWAVVAAAFLVFVLVPFGLLFISALARAARRRAARTARADPTRCLRCGYDLRGLELPRCPECGVLRGFTKSLEELGLSDAEIREGFARTRARRAADPAGRPTPPPDPPR